MKARTISDEDLRSAITIQKKTRTGEYICDCPFCHKSLHLYINIKTQVFQCKKCWTEGSVYKLLKQLDKTYLMGDKSIEYKDNILYINNEAVSEEFLNEEYKSQYPIFTEDFGPVQLSDDEYFCLGDNRINSKDSRYYGAFDAKQIKGVVNLMLWPFEVIKNEY